MTMFRTGVFGNIQATARQKPDLAAGTSNDHAACGKPMSKFVIKDWAGNTLFGGKKFSSFEEAWDHILASAPEDVEDDYFSDFYVVPFETEAEKRERKYRD